MKAKKNSKSLEPESSLDDNEVKEFSEDKITRMELKLEEMANQYNAFVQTMAKMQQRTDDILQMIIRPPEVQTDPGNGEKKKIDAKSEGIGDTLNKKFNDATVGELVSAGDLMLKVHDRRQGLTDLEEFMVGVGKNQITGFGAAQAHKQGAMNP